MSNGMVHYWNNFVPSLLQNHNSEIGRINLFNDIYPTTHEKCEYPLNASMKFSGNCFTKSGCFQAKTICTPRGIKRHQGQSFQNSQGTNKQTESLTSFHFRILIYKNNTKSSVYQRRQPQCKNFYQSLLSDAQLENFQKVLSQPIQPHKRSCGHKIW